MLGSGPPRPVSKLDDSNSGNRREVLEPLKSLIKPVPTCTNLNKIDQISLDKIKLA